MTITRWDAIQSSDVCQPLAEVAVRRPPGRQPLLRLDRLSRVAELTALGEVRGPSAALTGASAWRADEMSQDIKQVAWNSQGGTAEGGVVRKITKATQLVGRQVRASKEDPQYLARSEKSGGEAVHKPSTLTRMS